MPEQRKYRKAQYYGWNGKPVSELPPPRPDNTPALGGKGEDNSPGLGGDRRQLHSVTFPARAFGKVSAMWQYATRNAQHGDVLRLVSPDGDRYFRYNDTDGGRWLLEE